MKNKLCKRYNSFRIRYYLYVLENHIYKKLFPKFIYPVNYDSLVNNPESEIKKLIRWLNFEWDEKYLSPHLNKRSVLTSSSVQVRSPINSKSIGRWKNYKDMLQPAIEILSQTEKYQNLLL